MYKYIVWKFWSTLLVFILSVVLFYMVYVIVKGDPFISDPAYATDPEKYQNAIIQYGIDQPIFVRFGRYIAGIFRGDFGDIYKLTTSYTSIPALMFEPLKKSMLVTIPSYFAGMILGLGLGYWAGYRRGKMADYVINTFVTLFIAIPSFVFAIFALIIAPMLGLPVIFADSSDIGGSVGAMVKSLIAPVIVITLLSLAGWTYILRNEVASILASEFILSARTKGLSEKTIFWRYVLRNSMYPYIGSIVTSFMIVFGGSIIVERFFNVPGVSRTLVTASQTGEINILMFNFIFFSGISLFTQILVDVAQFSINPVVRAAFDSKRSFITKIVASSKRSKQRRLLIEEGGSND